MSALIAGTLALHAASVGDWVRLTPDSLDYLETARSLSETGRFPEKALGRPPGFSVVLSLLMAGRDTIADNFLNDHFVRRTRLLFAVCISISAALAFLLLRAEMGTGWSALAVALGAGSGVLLAQNGVLLSEPVFLPLSLVALLLAQRWRRGRARTADVFIGGLVCSAAALVRTLGLSLGLVGLVTLATGKHSSTARRLHYVVIFLIAWGGPLAAWAARQQCYPTERGYAHIWTHARPVEQSDRTGWALQAERFVRFSPVMLNSVKDALVPRHLGWRLSRPPLDGPAAWIVGGGVVLLTLVRLVRLRSPVDGYVLVTLGILSFWPWDEGPRLVSPLIPLFVAQAVGAARFLARRKLGAGFRGAAIGACAVACAAYAIEANWVLQGTPEAQRKAEQRLQTAERLASWLAANVPDNATWMAVTPEGSDSKTTLLAAAYLSRRPARAWDVLPDGRVDGEDAAPGGVPSLQGFSAIVTFQTTAQSVLSDAGLGPVDSIKSFVMYTHTE